MVSICEYMTTETQKTCFLFVCSLLMVFMLVLESNGRDVKENEGGGGAINCFMTIVHELSPLYSLFMGEP